LSLADFDQMTRKLGVSLIGQTDRICPADKKFYALRDVTATVESIPLIVGSILSKKLAEGVQSLVLDVKVGPGAFMKTEADARALAEALVGTAQEAGRHCTAFLTAMDRPLGTHIGNALEIIESIEILKGRGPADTRALTELLGGEMLFLAGVAPSLEAGKARIGRALDDGTALARFGEVVQAHGGDVRVIDQPELVLAKAPIIRPLLAWEDGVVSRQDALQIGLAAVRLGAGRNTAADVIDPAVGFVLAKKPGDAVQRGEPLAFVHARTESGAIVALQQLRDAMAIGRTTAPLLPLVLGEVRRAGV
jgi:pyrimidine-nucleoside phosphorylase